MADKEEKYWEINEEEECVWLPLKQKESTESKDKQLLIW